MAKGTNQLTETRGKIDNIISVSTTGIKKFGWFCHELATTNKMISEGVVIY